MIWGRGEMGIRETDILSMGFIFMQQVLRFLFALLFQGLRLCLHVIYSFYFLFLLTIFKRFYTLLRNVIF
jgi:hypothetical protein